MDIITMTLEEQMDCVLTHDIIKSYARLLSVLLSKQNLDIDKIKFCAEKLCKHLKVRG